ncbi:MAG: hypothetical protein AVDCRST_MAG49-535 [uncultured Thermomicrobiales bacterium]|uniref:Uncharacterized protein n=1 Tax=uncultured Thermomicrobiales bacterium TaxID=1645740 RepID=A0A6J4U405_9BACT|nr:MAG: hypothetical protein AVDCRST_MAG49-535 [uncultured Thermomicrobiales bacterium]
MSRLTVRVAAVGRMITPQPNPAYLAYARAVVAYGGGEPAGEAAVGLARWLESGRREQPCGRS